MWKKKKKFILWKILKDSFLKLYSFFVRKKKIKYQKYEFVFSTKDKFSKQKFLARPFSWITHEAGLTKFFIENIGSEEVFFDIWANLGYYSVITNNIITSWEVHSFEIDPFIFQVLRENISMNSNQNVFNKLNLMAIGSNDMDFVSFSPNKSNNPSTNQIDINQKNQSNTNVGCISLDDYCSATKVYPTLIKMDIEWGEYYAVDNMKEALFNNPRIFMEIHPNEINAMWEDFDAFKEKISYLFRERQIYKVINYRRESIEFQEINNIQKEPIKNQDMLYII